MPVYQVVGEVSVPFMVYVEAEDEDAAEEAVLRQSASLLLSNRTDGGRVEEATATGTSDHRAEIYEDD